jgi:integrase
MSMSKHLIYKGLTIRHRGQSWQVDFGTRDGKRVQRSFKTKQDAKTAIESHVEERRLEKIDNQNRRVAIFDLTDRQRIDMVTALERLPGNSSLTEAVEFYRKHIAPHGGQRTVAQLLDEYLAEKEKANRRKATLKEIRTRIGRFKQDFGQIPAHEITTHDLIGWMDRHGYRQVTRDNYRRAFVGFFNFAVKRGYAQVNPAEPIDRVSIDERLPEIFTPEEAKRLLYAAQEHSARMVSFFAIGLFAGLRPAEIEQTDWREIDLVKRRIRVRPEVAKKRRQRLVDISENLAEWLAPFRLDQGSVYFGRYEFDKVRRKANVQWASDIVRHSFGSYYIAQHEDAAKTAIQMGHIRTDVLFNHYRDLVTREEADAYWKILPRPQSNLIQMAAE